MSEAHDVTTLLHRARDGDPDALDRLVPLVYDQLRRLAQGQRRRHGAAETVNTTALVHEAYAKLADREGVTAWADRQHFFRIAARAMRDVLVDYARAQQAAKRGGSQPDRSLSDLAADALGALPPLRIEEVLDLDGALDRLEALDAQQARLVELRYFTGLTIPEAAEILEMSPATAKRRWSVARAWLYRELSG
ncbi:MAG: ECF-type sigma factor [Bacteroidota bacterium]